MEFSNRPREKALRAPEHLKKLDETDLTTLGLLHLHGPTSPYIAAAMEYYRYNRILDHKQEEGITTIADYAISVGDRELATHCVSQQRLSATKRWRLFAKSATSEHDALHMSVARQLGEERATPASNIQALQLDLLHLAGEVSLSEFTKTDNESTRYHLGEVTRSIHAHIERFTDSNQIHDELGILINNLATHGRFTETMSIINSCRASSLRREALQLLTLHRAHQGDLTREELKQIYKTHLKPADHDERISGARLFTLFAAGHKHFDEAAVEEHFNRYRAHEMIYWPHPDHYDDVLEPYVQDFVQTHYPKLHLRLARRTFFGYEDLDFHGCSLNEASKNIKSLLNTGEVAKAKQLYEVLSNEIQHIAPKPKLLNAHLAATLHLAKYELWQKTE